MPFSKQINRESTCIPIRQFPDMLGYTSEEMKSKTIADISPPNKIEEYFKFFER